MEDIIGKIFYKLKVVEKTTRKDKKSQYLYKCICDCGNEKYTLGYRLKNGSVRSCGCNRRGLNNKRWSGCGEISGNCFSGIREHRNRRDGRNLEFTITKEYIWNLFIKQDRKCKLSGVDLKFKKKNRDSWDLQTASLDRIDSDKGYMIGNVQWIHKDINQMKMDLTEDYFIEMCKKIIKHKESYVKK